MAAGSTYTPIATTTLGSAQSSVTFSTISGSYTDLVLIGSYGTANGNCPLMQFNSDTGSNYSITELVGNGSSASSSRRSNGTSIDIAKTVGGNGNLEQNFVISIQNYSNSTTYKTALVRQNLATGTYSSDRFNINFNSDTGSNYSYHTLDTNGGGTVGTGYGASEAFIDISMTTGSAATGSIFTGTVIDILDYANTSKYKSVKGLSGFDNNTGASNLQGYISFSSGNWMNTNAITSIKLTPRYGTNFVQYSQFALYGIKGA